MEPRENSSSTSVNSNSIIFADDRSSVALGLELSVFGGCHALLQLEFHFLHTLGSITAGSEIAGGGFVRLSCGTGDAYC